MVYGVCVVLIVLIVLLVLIVLMVLQGDRCRKGGRKPALLSVTRRHCAGLDKLWSLPSAHAR